MDDGVYSMEIEKSFHFDRCQAAAIFVILKQYVLSQNALKLASPTEFNLSMYPGEK